MKEPDGRPPEIRAHFSPAVSADFGSKSSGPLVYSAGGSEEYGGEDHEPQNNMLVFFGKAEEIKPNDCPPVFTTSDEVVMDYMDAHSIELLLEHMLTLCSIHFPGIKLNGSDM
jgi:hypothetical protein